MPPYNKPLTDAEREAAQHAYFSGRSEGLPPATAAPRPAKPFWVRPIPPAAGVAGGLAAAGLATASLLLWPSKRPQPPFPGQQQPVRPMSPPTLQVSDQVFVMTPTVKRLDEIAEGAPFRADFGTVNTLRGALYGTAFQKPAKPEDVGRLVLETAPPADNAPLQVVKKGGKFYLCAYTFGRVPEDALERAAEGQTARTAPWRPGERRPSPPAPAPLVTLYSSQTAASDEQLRGAGRPSAPRPSAGGVPAGAPVGMPSGGGPARPAVGMSFASAPQPEALGDDPSDGALVQVLVPLDGFGGNYSMHGYGSKAVIRAAITRLDANAYAGFRPLPSPSPAPGALPQLSSGFMAAGGAGGSMSVGSGGVRMSGGGVGGTSMATGSW